jgi:hypothetical protein
MSAPKPVTFAEVSSVAMVAGNEARIEKVIHEGMVKHWVGIGWIDIREATPHDFQTIPQVVKNREPKSRRKP